MDYSSYFKKRENITRFNSTFGDWDLDKEKYPRLINLQLIYNGNIHGFASGRGYMNFIDYTYFKNFNKNIIKVIYRNKNTFLKENNITSMITDIDNLIDTFLSIRPLFNESNFNISYDKLFEKEPAKIIAKYGRRIYCNNIKKYNYGFRTYPHRYSENAYLKKCFNILTEYVFNKKDVKSEYRELAKPVYIKLLNYMNTYARDTYNELLTYMNLSNANPIRGDFRNPVFLYVLQFAGNNMINEALFDGTPVSEICKKYNFTNKKLKNMVIRECNSHIFNLINEDKTTVEKVVSTFNLSDEELIKMAIKV